MDTWEKLEEVKKELEETKKELEEAWKYFLERKKYQKLSPKSMKHFTVE